MELKKGFKRAFTLAEIMIVLSIIGVLTAILMPIALHSAPDENVMKFKKADTTLKNVIRELVNSDKYYADGELGKKSDSSFVEDGSYFCATFSEIISVKSSNCTDGDKRLTNAEGYFALSWANNDMQALKNHFDEVCKETALKMKDEIVASDGVVYYETNYTPFGITIRDYYKDYPIDDPVAQGWVQSLSRAFYSKNNEGFYEIYKPFCIDIDSIPKEGSANCDDKKDVCPFGYGIRVDGKIVSGKRADEWLAKGFQKGANDN